MFILYQWFWIVILSAIWVTLGIILPVGKVWLAIVVGGFALVLAYAFQERLKEMLTAWFEYLNPFKE